MSFDSQQFPLWLFLGTHGYSDNGNIVSVAWFQKGNDIVCVRRSADDVLVPSQVLTLPGN
jgi:hypothetical protein